MINDFENSILNLFGIGTIIAQILLLLLIILYIFNLNSKSNKIKSLVLLIKSNAINFAFLLSTSATVGSLILSEVLKYPPCDLCWFQRIFMYPQTIILLIAVLKNDMSVKLYSLTLSIFGLLFAIYHFMLQNFPTILPCTSNGVSCATKTINLFGYITIPVMSATAFLLIIVTLMFSFERKKRGIS